MQILNTVTALEVLRSKITHIISIVAEQKGGLPSVEFPLCSGMNGEQSLVVRWEESMTVGSSTMPYTPDLEDETVKCVSVTLVRRISICGQGAMINHIPQSIPPGYGGHAAPQMQHFPNEIIPTNVNYHRTDVGNLAITNVTEEAIEDLVTSAFVKFVEMNRATTLNHLAGMTIVTDMEGISIHVTDPKFPERALFRYCSPDTIEFGFAIHKAAALALVYHKENHHVVFSQSFNRNNFGVF